jgi:hypothetical protein
MSEFNKTAIFFVVAAAAVALALFTRPSTEEYDVDELRGTELVEEFPSDAPKRLRITNMDAETGDIDAFEVAEVDGVWSIPSKSGYPADATEQMAAAVEGVVGREVLMATPIGAGDYATYGVVDPTDTTADEGFGTHVRLSDKDDKVLADLIIGKEVTGSEGQYWVRKAKQDVVYAAEIDLDKFSTDFSNWIEKDLLGLSTFDVSQVMIDDYTIETEMYLTRQGFTKGISDEDRRARMHLVYDDEASKWQAESLEMYSQEKESYEPFTLGENQELNEDALRELKNALDDLEIVDVEKKPDGLSSDLRAGDDFMKNNEALSSLMRRGFLPVREDPNNPASDIVLLSSEGEIVVTLKDGVEYVLRFGDLQLDPSAETGEKPAETTDAATESPAETSDDEGLNRYLFVMAQFNESAIEKPTPEELPELPAEETSNEEPQNDDVTEVGDAADEQQAEEVQADDAADQSGDEDSSDAADDATEEEEKKPTREEIEAERKRIEENNKRGEDEYQEKIAAGKKRVGELNARFGDWYYVIPNDVFKKIHLGRDEVIKAKEEEADTAGGQPNAEESMLGAPGAQIPGLPSSGPELETDSAPADLDDATTDGEPSTGEPSTGEPSNEDGSTEEAAADETAGDEPASDETPDEGA